MQSEVPARLKCLRERSKLSVREMARRVGLSASGYTHYENPERFKGDFLPLAEAMRFAKAFAGTGVTEAEVLALAGTRPANPKPATEHRGFGESDAAPLIYKTGDRTAQLSALLTPKGAKAVLYRIGRAVASLGHLPGDTLVVETPGAQQDGDLLLVSHWADDGSGITLLRRKHGGLLIGAEPGDPMPVIDIDDSGRIAIIGTVIASYREA